MKLIIQDQLTGEIICTHYARHLGSRLYKRAIREAAAVEMSVIEISDHDGHICVFVRNMEYGPDIYRFKVTIWRSHDFCEWHLRDNLETIHEQIEKKTGVKL